LFLIYLFLWRFTALSLEKTTYLLFICNVEMPPSCDGDPSITCIAATTGDAQVVIITYATIAKNISIIYKIFIVSVVLANSVHCWTPSKIFESILLKCFDGNLKFCPFLGYNTKWVLNQPWNKGQENHHKIWVCTNIF